MQREIILHTHIFKNAGTTFDFTLKNNFNNGFIDDRDDERMIGGGQRHLESILQKDINIKAISSHAVYFRAINNKEYKYHQVYFLRNPYIRAHSVFLFEKNQMGSTTPGSQMAKTLDFKNFVKWYLREDSPATIRNCQAIFISGLSEQNFTKKTHRISIEIAKESKLIGIVEKYDLSMKAFKVQLQQSFQNISLDYTIQNTSNLEMSTEDRIAFVKSELGNLEEEFVMKNSTDFELYAIVEKKINHSIIDA